MERQECGGVLAGKGFFLRYLVLVGERKTMKYMRLTFWVGGALGLLRRCLVGLLSIGCLLHLLSFPAFSHICYESLADTDLFSLYLSEIINIRTANQSKTS